MQDNIISFPKWLPPPFKIKDFVSEIDFINHLYTIFENDFMNPDNPLIFDGKIVKYSPVKLYKRCEKLLKKGFQSCNNKNFNCTNCPYVEKEDIFNHLTTKDFVKNSKSCIRTPGIFEPNRAVRMHWIRIIIENYAKAEVSYYQEFDTAENAINHCFWLKDQKYLTVVREDKTGRLFLTTSYYLYDKNGTDRMRKAYKRYNASTKKTLTSKN